ncbi:uncharacterized protein BKA78DRAFT_164551 [Phyllosticta capitalensis]|uniref:uncharacterized protein n=1 Tax=Phyllosticta capitalensis TaxID=121624 RepID=UPI00312DC6EE
MPFDLQELSGRIDVRNTCLEWLTELAGMLRGGYWAMAAVRLIASSHCHGTFGYAQAAANHTPPRRSRRPSSNPATAEPVCGAGAAVCPSGPSAAFFPGCNNPHDAAYHLPLSSAAERFVFMEVRMQRMTISWPHRLSVHSENMRGQKSDVLKRKMVFVFGTEKCRFIVEIRRCAS